MTVVREFAVEQAWAWLRQAKLPDALCRQLMDDASSFLTDDMDDDAILSALLTAAVQNIVADPAFERAAARLLLLQIHREAAGAPHPDYATYFPRYIAEGVERGCFASRPFAF
jgi:hypothetical protein